MHHLSGKQLLLVAFAILTCLQGCYDTTDPGVEDTEPPNLDAQSEVEIEVWELINEHRISENLSSLQLDSTISHIARRHSRDMAEGRVPVGHDGFSERAEAIIAQIGGSSVAENVAAGYESAETVVAGWINSSGHRQNIEGEYNLTGVGVTYGDDGTPYYTQIFLLK